MRYLVILLLLCSCGPASKLRRAERLIKAAMADGAKVKTDTVYRDIKFTAPEISFETTLLSPNWNDTLYITGKDSIQVKIKRTPATKSEPEVVYVEAKCPERDVTTSVPVAVNQKISAGYTLWDLIILVIFCLVVGYFGGHILVNTIRRRT